MIGIGEFSHRTGPNIKTLRYYHDIGLLSAAHVDDFNGYRSYSASQLQDAALLRVLRATGMGIPQMKQALTHPHELTELLQARRRELDAQRELEDWALPQAPRWQECVSIEAVRTRECEPVHWAGVEARIGLKELGEDPQESEVEARFEGLQTGFEHWMAQLSELGCAVIPDSFWMSFTSDPRQPSVLRASYCIETREPLTQDIAIDGVDVVKGELPRRTEAFVTTPIPTSEEPPAEELAAARLPGGPLPHPTALALCRVAEQAGVDSAPLRQRAITLTKGQVIEHSLTLATH